MSEPNKLTKMKRSLPWLIRYPLWLAGAHLNRALKSDTDSPQHLIISVANHFEPSWRSDSTFADLDTQLFRLQAWVKQAEITGQTLRDHDDRPFRHTNFFPAEQYHRPLLELMAELEAGGYGEVEIHLHHGVKKPDTPENLRHALIEFRDILAEEHKCLSYEDGDPRPRYAFVHGNLALANSMSGFACGVDNELEILSETGCYADLTMPSAPEESQSAIINSIYQCGRPLNERAAHHTGQPLHVGASNPVLPIILPGPLILDWSRNGFRPSIEGGVVTQTVPLSRQRLQNWRKANVTVQGRPDWVFIKLYCHGFFDNDLVATLGEPVIRFWSEVMQEADRTGEFKLHFATSRESFNMVMAAVDGKSGDPSLYRDYRLKPIRTAPQQQIPRLNAAVTGR